MSIILGYSKQMKNISTDSADVGCPESLVFQDILQRLITGTTTKH